MRREADYFGGRELVLLYIAKRLNEALKLEALLNQVGLDYLVEPDRYYGGIIFRGERVGAFFYVAPESAGWACQCLRDHGYRPLAEGG